MIGYYVHHVGAGHLNRARAVALRAEVTVTGLSSLPMPADWPGPWVQLDAGRLRSRGRRPDGAERNLHWVPARRRRLVLAGWRRSSSWMETARPGVLVSDVSAEVALLARLHGVPVVSVVLPGRRGDRAHRSAYAVSSGLVAAWPREAAGMVRGLAPADARRLHPVGALSRLGSHSPGRAPGPSPGPRPARDVEVATPPKTSSSGRRRRTRLVLDGAGRARARGGTTRPLPSRDADVVVIQAGENARGRGGRAPAPRGRRPGAASARRAADHRPSAWPRGRGRAVVEARLPATGWGDAPGRGGCPGRQAWAGWCDGLAAERLAEYLDAFASRRRRSIA